MGHEVERLAAYAEDQLDAPDRARVARHVEQCAQCREALQRVRHGISLASQLRGEPMPPEVAIRIKGLIENAPANVPINPTARRFRSSSYAAAAVVLIAVGVSLYWQVNRPWVRLYAASEPSRRFENEGRQLHDQLVSGTVSLSFTSADEGALWRWLASQGAPVTSIEVARPDHERTQFVPLGAAVLTIGGAKTSVLSYRIDGRPVTLALASSRDVAEAPPSGWWTKRVMHRRDEQGINTLTWTVGGGTYVLVSELDGSGQRACLICHTAPKFRQRIVDLRP
jgi:anti-sigma factor RsiW